MRTIIIALSICFFCLVSVSYAQSANNGEAKYEIVFWESVKDSDDPRLFQSYLDRYPNGVFAELARLSIAKYGGSIREVESPQVSTPAESEVAAPPKAAIRTQRSSTCKVAVFPWNLVEDGHYMTAILKDNVRESIARYSNLKLSYSYYSFPKRYGIESLQRSGMTKINKRKLWRRSQPEPAYISDLGQQAGVDAVLIGTIRVSNPWSDRYKLGYIRIFFVDVHSQRVVKTQNISSSRDAAEELPLLMQDIIDQYYTQFCRN